MVSLTWQDAFQLVAPYVVKISTPRGSGTGFVFGYTGNRDFCGIATAAHVIEGSHGWEEPIRIQHHQSGKVTLTRPGERVVRLDEGIDTAAIVVRRGDFPLPEAVLDLIPSGKILRVGIEVGWLGFPALAPNSLCFFSGRTSCWLKDQGAYLVDGVAINGVSGGPAFHLVTDGTVQLIGVVSAYIPNRATGESLPGLSVVRHVSQFQQLLKAFQSLEEARDEETPPEQVREQTSPKEPGGA